MAFCCGTGQDEQHECVVLLSGYGSRRLPVEKFLLHIVSVGVVERGELTTQAQ